MEYIKEPKIGTSSFALLLERRWNEFLFFFDRTRNGSSSIRFAERAEHCSVPRRNHVVLLLPLEIDGRRRAVRIILHDYCVLRVGSTFDGMPYA